MTLVNGRYALKNPEYVASGSPEPFGVTRTNMLRSQIASNTAFGTTGQIVYVGIALEAGITVNNVGVLVGTTAVATATHFFGALYDPSGNLLAQSTDQQLLKQTSGLPAKTTGVTALTAKTAAYFVLGSQATPTPLTVATSGWYFVAFGLTAGTMGTLYGLTVADVTVSGNVTGTAAASQVSETPSGLVVKQGSASGTAGNYYNDNCLAQLDASTATGTAPAKITTNGAPTGLAFVPFVSVS